MNHQERLAAIAAFVATANTALEEAKRLSEEGGIPFAFVFPAVETEEEDDWQSSEDAWADSGCTIGDEY